MKRFLTLVLFVVVACTAEGGTPTSVVPPTTGVSTTTVATSETTLPPTTAGGGCEGEMVEAGNVGALASPESDAEQLSAITWQTDLECEIFSLEFTSEEGAPATTAPEVSAEFDRTSAVLRVFVDVEATAVTDQLVQSFLVDRLFVVRQLENRTLFVDFHLAAPALARFEVAGGRIDVLLEPGGSEYEAVASFADNVVVVTPTPGAVNVPFTVAGYSRNFEANTVVQITQDGEVIAEDFTTAADWVETWGEFELELSPDGSGPAELFVGEFSAQDGSPRGLVLDVEY